MMFKTGDDMRQDAIVLQLFDRMDKLLQHEYQTNCGFSIYKLIPFTTNDGLLQFVPDSDTITEIMNEDKTIEAWIRRKNKFNDKKSRQQSKGCFGGGPVIN